MFAPDTVPVVINELAVNTPLDIISFAYTVDAAKFIYLFDDNAIIDWDNALFGVDIFIS